MPLFIEKQEHASVEAIQIPFDLDVVTKARMGD